MANNRQTAMELGLHPNWFHTVKKTNMEKYRYICSLDPNLKKGYIKYLEENEQLMRDLEELYYELYDDRSIYEFSRYLYKKGLYKHRNTFSTVIIKYIRKIEPVFRHSSFIKLRQVGKEKEAFLKLKEN
jgi:hypothetical protein